MHACLHVDLPKYAQFSHVAQTDLWLTMSTSTADDSLYNTNSPSLSQHAQVSDSRSCFCFKNKTVTPWLRVRTLVQGTFSSADGNMCPIALCGIPLVDRLTKQSQKQVTNKHSGPGLPLQHSKPSRNRLLQWGVVEGVRNSVHNNTMLFRRCLTINSPVHSGPALTKRFVSSVLFGSGGAA